MKEFTKSMLLGLFAIAMSQTARADWAPEGVYLRHISYAGSGCPAGSLFQDLTENGIRILWDSFAAEAGPGLPLSEGRKACQILFDINVPSGWQYAVENHEFHGYVDLDSGASATLQSTYYFQGQLRQATVRSTVRGPRSGDISVSDNLSASSQVWSPCGLNRALNLRVSASVSAGFGRRALVTVDSVLGSALSSLTLRWRRC